jgi:Rho GDP-dissociation inhibitor
MTDIHHEDDDLAPTQTTGYKPGEKKTLQDYQTLDAQDESLNKWKESLGLNKSAGKFFFIYLYLFQPPPNPFY